ncbi:MAG: hypothetical protein JO189_31360 [Deltaproteobacteria bacterium]|nr:hypothetical protein [Deltaproteobacteria bacterium]
MVPDPYPHYPYPYESLPALRKEHVEGALLFANRVDLISACTSAKGGVIAEIGVAAGDFQSLFLIG